MHAHSRVLLLAVLVLVGCGSGTKGPSNAATADFSAAWACRDHATISDAVAGKTMSAGDAYTAGGPMMFDANAAFDLNSKKWGALDDDLAGFRVLMKGVEPTGGVTALEDRISTECAQVDEKQRQLVAGASDDPGAGQDPAPK